MTPETFNRLQNTSKEDFDQFVDWLFSHTLRELRAARGDLEATRTAWVHYFRQGLRADLLLDELMKHLPELFRRAQYAEEEARRVSAMIKALNFSDIGIQRTDTGVTGPGG
jgi:galactokinase